ncbi:hypothetical protein BH09ACT12_BH09ACT12_08720 [soil metagenome]
MVPVTTQERCELGSWSGAWDALAAQADPPSPFSRAWWLERLPESERLFVLVLDGDTLLGGVALRSDRLLGVRRLRMLGNGVLCGDHLDAVHDRARRASVVRELSEWFAAAGPVLLDLTGLVAHSLVADAVGRTSRPIDVAPYGMVAPTPPGPYLASRSRNLRRSVGRAQRHLADEGYLRQQLAPERVHDAIAWFDQLQRPRPDRAPLLAAWRELDVALTAGLEAGDIRLDVLRRGDDLPVALCVAFWVERRLSLYQVARSLAPEHRDVATVLMVEVIEDAVRQGAVEIDLLRGNEPYKSRLVDDSRTLHRVQRAHGTIPRVLMALLRAAAGSRALVAHASRASHELRSAVTEAVSAKRNAPADRGGQGS